MLEQYQGYNYGLPQGIVPRSMNAIPNSIGPVNGHREPTTISGFLGRRGGYCADIFRGEAYEGRKQELAEIAIGIITRSGLWSEPVARVMMERGMNTAPNVQDTSMTLFRKSDGPLDRYIGVSWQELVFVPTTLGIAPVDYLKLRAFEEKHRKKGLGKTAVEIAVSQTTVRPFLLAHRTGSPAAALSFMESPVFKEGTGLSPYDMRYDEDPMRQEVMMKLHFQYRVQGREINMSTGVSPADYIEANGAFVLDLTHSKIMSLYRRLEELGMVFARRDSIIAMGELK